MRSTILNREFQHPPDGWYQIETPGEHLNAAGGVMQVIDAPAVSSIVNRFNQEADDYQQSTGKPFPGMLIDHEHFKHQMDKETRAYGWLMRLENRNGVPFGQINWTATGKPAIDGGDYRFFSSEYDPADLQILNSGQKPTRARPVRLSGLSLTNDPNNKGGAPITNRGPATAARGAILSGRSREEAAASEVLAQATQIKNRTGCSFTEAWNQVTQANPVLTNRMHGSSHALPRKSAAEAASNALVEYAREAQRASAGLPFERAWDMVCNRHPAVFAMANRRANDPEVDPADWKKANACEAAVLEQLDSEQNEPMDRGTLSSFSHPAANPGIARNTFRSVIQHMMTDDGLTLQQASDKLKADEPIFWTLAMLALNPEQ